MFRPFGLGLHRTLDWPFRLNGGLSDRSGNICGSRYKRPNDACQTVLGGKSLTGMLGLTDRYAVAVPDRRMDVSQYGVADVILQSLEDFDPEEWHLPPFE